MSYDNPTPSEKLVLRYIDQMIKLASKISEAITYDIHHYGRITNVSSKVVEEARKELFNEMTS